MKAATGHRSKRAFWGPLLVAILVIYLIFKPGWAEDKDQINLSEIALGEVKLGATQGEVKAAFPRMLFQEVAYEDPAVGLAYAPFYGEEVIEKITGSSQQGEGERLRNISVSLTGDGRLYRIEIQDIGKDVVCSPLFDKLAAQYGPPDLTEEPYLAEWLQRDFDLQHSFKLECFEGRRAIRVLEDQTAEAAYLAALRNEVQTAVDQVVTRPDSRPERRPNSPFFPLPLQ